MRRFAEMGNLDVWYARLDVDAFVREAGGADATQAVQKAQAKAMRKNSLRAVEKFSRRVNGRVELVSDPPLIVPIADLLGDVEAEAVTAALRALLSSYRRSLPGDRRHLLDGYDIVDMARKVVGVGSVGTRAWILLLRGRDADDPLVLQAKEAQASVLAPYVGASRYSNQGQRVVEGQRLMQAASDIFLGWDRVTGLDGQLRDFYVRQLWDGKLSVDLERMPDERLTVYVRACAWMLARAHARSGDRIAIAAYVGDGDAFDTSMVEFAADYADQNERDYAALADDVRAGRIAARTDL
jgi:uncharacterized protein (DUF2252 family)